MYKFTILFSLKRLGIAPYLLFIFLLSCSSYKDDSDVKTIHVDLLNNNTIPKIEILKTIPLETNDTCLIGEITTIFVDNCFFVFDNRHAKTLMKFDLAGKFVKKIQHGKGPGELIKPRAIDINDNHISIWDPGDMSLKEYNLSLELLSSKKKELVMRNFCKYQDSLWLVRSAYYDYYKKKFEDKDFYNYYIYNSDFEKIEERLIPLNKKHFNVMLPNTIAKNKQPLFCCLFNHSLYTIKDNYQAIKEYNIDFGKFNITKTLLEKDVKTIFSMQRNNEIIANIYGINCNDRYISVHFTSKRTTEFFIYNKDNKKVYLSNSIINKNILPKGEIKQILEDNSFIYVVSAVDYMKFLKRLNKTEPNNITSQSNPIIMIFKIDA